MADDTRRLLEDLGLAYTAMEVSDLNEKLSSLQEQNAEQERLRRLRAVQAEVKEVEERSAEKGDKFRDLGMNCFGAKQWQEAREHYEVAARSYPETYIYKGSGVYCRKMMLYEIAKCLRELGKFDESLQVMEALRGDKNLAPDPDYLKIFLKGLDQDLLETYERALQANLPKSPEQVNPQQRRYILAIDKLSPGKHPEYEKVAAEEMKKENQERIEEDKLKQHLDNLVREANKMQRWAQGGIGYVVVGVLSAIVLFLSSLAVGDSSPKLVVIIFKVPAFSLLALSFVFFSKIMIRQRKYSDKLEQIQKIKMKLNELEKSGP